VLVSNLLLALISDILLSRKEGKCHGKTSARFVHRRIRVELLPPNATSWLAGWLHLQSDFSSITVQKTYGLVSVAWRFGHDDNGGYTCEYANGSAGPQALARTCCPCGEIGEKERDSGRLEILSEELSNRRLSRQSHRHDRRAKYRCILV